MLEAYDVWVRGQQLLCIGRVTNTLYLRSVIRAVGVSTPATVAWLATPKVALAHGVHLPGIQSELVAVLIPILVFIIVAGLGILAVLSYFKHDFNSPEDDR